MSNFIGTTGDDSLNGTPGADTIYGLDGNDLIYGGDGADLIFGGNGDDDIQGGTGDDTIHGGGRVDSINGGDGDDYITSFRNDYKPGSTALKGGNGNDTLIASVEGSGQVHLRGGGGDDTLEMDLTNELGRPGQGHHSYGGSGADTFVFSNLHLIESPVVGRIDDLDLSQDSIVIKIDANQSVTLDLNDLPITITLADGASMTVRVVDFRNSVLSDSELGTQQFLALGTKALYALEGARLIESGAEEQHFVEGGNLTEADIAALETVDYVDQTNFVPVSHYAHLTLNDKSSNNVNIKPGPGTDFSGNDFVHADKPNGNTNALNRYGQVIDTRGGNDVVNANSGHDTVYGGDGNDSIAGGLDDDVLHGDSGNDYLWGGSQNDVLYGGTGDDVLEGGTGDDMLSGGAGNDTFAFRDHHGNDTISDFDIETDVLTFDGDLVDLSDPLSTFAVEYTTTGVLVHFTTNTSVLLKDLTNVSGDILGTDGDDILIGTGGEDFMMGGIGHDSMSGGANRDKIYGGRGKDLLEGDHGNDVLDAGRGNDSLYGGDGADALYGGDHNDLLDGGDGADNLFGNAGDDTLTGGAGADQFVFKTGDGSDIITDFTDGEDRIRIVTGADEFADLTILDLGADALVVFSDVVILLENVDHTDLSAADFIF